MCCCLDSRSVACLRFLMTWSVGSFGSGRRRCLRLDVRAGTVSSRLTLLFPLLRVMLLRRANGDVVAAMTVETDILGDQRPRIEAAPDSPSPSGQDAVDLSAACGLELDDWQQYVLRRSLAERDDGKWAAYDVALVVARQNGKGAVLMAREIAGALLFGERLILHTAHELDTARDHMKKLNQLAEDSPFLRKLLPADGFKWGRGYEEAQFSNGAVIRFKSRTRKGGRGLSGDLVVFDEAFELSQDVVGATTPLLRARDNPQVWYASSTVDQTSMPHGVVLTEKRNKALSDVPPERLAYFEWSNPDGLVDGMSAREIQATIGDPDVWAAANPALGIRIDPEQIATEVDSMPLRQFLVECLSVGDWPNIDGDGQRDDRPLTPDMWDGLVDRSAKMQDPVVFAVDVSPDRSTASIVAAGWTLDGRLAVELVDRRPGVAWLEGRVGELDAKHDPKGWVMDAYAAVDLPVEPTLTSQADVAEAFKRFVDAAVDGTLTHLGQQGLSDAVGSYKTRNLYGGLAVKSGGGDVSCLVAATLAAWRHLSAAEKSPEPFFLKG